MLERLLKSVDAMDSSDYTLRITVVDNDEDQSARDVVSSFERATYKTEMHPGIPAARNASLDSILPDDDFVLFVDDDEFVSPNWVDLLLSTAERMQADVVTGPVIPDFPPGTPAWISSGGFWQRLRHPSDSPIDHVATNNTLVRTSLLRRKPEVRFQDRFRFTGGSDTQFFLDLADDETVFLWNDDAAVFETVIRERANAKWLFRRAMRIGNVNARYENSRFKLFVGGLARIAAGATLSAWSLLVRHRLEAHPFNMTAHGIGYLGSFLSIDIQEYK